MNAIDVSDLGKEYSFAIRNPNKSWFQNFFTPDIKSVHAVNSVLFSVPRGETLAFIGPNGAGKSTTIKMLTGILHPTAGSATVLGLSPQTDRKRLAMRIGTVFGQRSQLVFNLPLKDSFDLLAHVYDVSKADYAVRFSELVESFDLSDFIDQPVRKLSLGQRMRAEVAASLIHNPEILFLDEPTIGLDVVAKRALREALRARNRTSGTTIFLTSHDAGDIEAICSRTIVINHGAVMFDGPTADMRRTYLGHKIIRAEWAGDMPGNTEMEVVSSDVPATVSKLFAEHDITDISIEEPPLEEVIRTMYQHARS